MGQISSSTRPAHKTGLTPLKLLDFLLPNHCHLCDQPCSEVLCPQCQQELPRILAPCEICSLPLVSSASGVCGECLHKPPSFDRSLCTFSYTEQIPALINHFKHRRHIHTGKLLSSHLCHLAKAYHLDCANDKPDCLTAVPLHWRHCFLRGFNQANVIAKALAQELDIPLLPLLQKKHATKHQQQLGRKSRLSNLKQVFSIASSVKALHIGVVDDVITTGATVETISSLLKRAGAKQVTVYALARTPKFR